jgi:N-glycosylase/DNA lyase
MLSLSLSLIIDLGFGYRAKFITSSCQTLFHKGDDWLFQLRATKSAQDVQNELLELHGVGRKVADCIALFSLDKKDAIPVDTHVWAIACRDYDSELLNSKSLTPKIYNHVGELFRKRFGSHAGWAHSVLFAAEIAPWRDLLPKEMQVAIAIYLENLCPYL